MCICKCFFRVPGSKPITEQESSSESRKLVYFLGWGVGLAPGLFGLKVPNLGTLVGRSYSEANGSRRGVMIDTLGVWQ